MGEKTPKIFAITDVAAIKFWVKATITAPQKIMKIILLILRELSSIKDDLSYKTIKISL